MKFEEVKVFPAFRRRNWKEDTFIVDTEFGYKLSTPENLCDWEPSKNDLKKNDWEIIF